MNARLVSPAEAGVKLAVQIGRRWADAVCAEAQGDGYPFKIPLRPNVTSGAVVERHLMGDWGDWRAAWRHLGLPDEAGSGAWVASAELSVAGSVTYAPKWFHAPDLDSAAAALGTMGGGPVKVDLARAREIARRLRAGQALLTAGALKRLVGFSETDLVALLRVLDFLTTHPDVSRWSARQLPIPGVHTKWLDSHMALVRGLSGRDLDAELRRRPTAIHLTYVDPDYLADQDRRRHDAWTAGDEHQLAYRPRTVVVVENRDCRLFFPPLEGAVVVEGVGFAAAALVAEIPWVRDAERVVYWGDMDAEGYAILNRFRAAMPTKVDSILMDLVTMSRFAEQGVSVDKDGRPLKPCPTQLPELDDAEAAAYATIAAAGEAEFRRIEQEKLPIEEAAALLASR
ncbi:Wadjet anti-phage system protein JetD domain-containing protein [Nocardioides sp. NPDC051685]|uniref:Wadjet anti-phage system protein JetD domain-containing protein n=1 Tax=Nocardioides sp. NPDC051685 TaxID=3364334 RepID=UPI00378EC2B1